MRLGALGQSFARGSCDRRTHRVRRKNSLGRNRAWKDVFFGLITGFIERDESPEQAVAREVKEEVGLDTTSTSLVGVYDFQRKNELIIAYHVRAQGEIVLNEELCDYRLIAPEELRPWESGTGLAVRDWLAGRGLLKKPELSR